MIGLAILIFFTVYLVVSILVTMVVARWAKRNNRSPWYWGGTALFVMYNLVFWDFIPTLVVHKYYCEKQAGFRVYKTPEQWKMENPGVAEMLTWKEIPDPSDTIKQPNGIVQYVLNERFLWEVTPEQPVLVNIPVFLRKSTVIDRTNNKEMAKEIIISSGYGNFMLGANGQAIKFWLNQETCPSNSQIPISQYKKLGKEIK